MKISEEKKRKISEQILAFLYSSNPRPLFTAHIAKEIARDEEFIKKIMENLKKENLVLKINKNPTGKEYKRRTRWKLTDAAYQAYKKASSV